MTFHLMLFPVPQESSTIRVHLGSKTLSTLYYSNPPNFIIENGCEYEAPRGPLERMVPSKVTVEKFVKELFIE